MPERRRTCPAPEPRKCSCRKSGRTRATTARRGATSGSSRSRCAPVQASASRPTRRSSSRSYMRACASSAGRWRRFRSCFTAPRRTAARNGSPTTGSTASSPSVPTAGRTASNGARCSRDTLRCAARATAASFRTRAARSPSSSRCILTASGSRCSSPGATAICGSSPTAATKLSRRATSSRSPACRRTDSPGCR